MSSYIFGFPSAASRRQRLWPPVTKGLPTAQPEIDKTMLAMVGGKGANLGELCRVEGINVPDGFCISTEAFKRIIGESSSINGLLDQLSFLQVEDRDKISELSGEIRRIIEGITIPQDIQVEINRPLSNLDEKNAWAVRSSATAEDPHRQKD